MRIRLTTCIVSIEPPVAVDNRDIINQRYLYFKDEDDENPYAIHPELVEELKDSKTENMLFKLGVSFKDSKIVTDEIKKLAEFMIHYADNNNGIGLAAPQMGVPIRLFVLRDYNISPEGK